MKKYVYRAGWGLIIVPPVLAMSFYVVILLFSDHPFIQSTLHAIWPNIEGLVEFFFALVRTCLVFPICGVILLVISTFLNEKAESTEIYEDDQLTEIDKKISNNKAEPDSSA